jgi:hypothetical protein
VLAYGVVSAELFPRREDADQMLADALSDEPD